MKSRTEIGEIAEEELLYLLENPIEFIEFEFVEKLELDFEKKTGTAVIVISKTTEGDIREGEE